MVRRYTLRPASRLRRNADFLEIRDEGKPYRCPYFALFSRIRVDPDADSSRPRIGISASRRVGNSVQRNQAKRRLRELFRLHQHSIKPSADLVVSLRPPAVRATYQQLEQRFLHALRFQRLLRAAASGPGDPEASEGPSNAPPRPGTEPNAT